MCADWLQVPSQGGRGKSGGVPVGEFRPAGMSDSENSDYSDDFDYDFGTNHKLYDRKTEPQATPFASFTPDRELLVRKPAKPPVLLHSLKYAITKGSQQSVHECLAKLKSQDFDVNNTLLDDDWPALMFACQTPRPAILSFLIDQGADPKLITFENCTPFIALACANNQNGDFANMLKCAEILMDSGVEVNETESRLGAAALHFAVKNDHRDLVEFFLQHDANIHQLDRIGRTPFHWAASHGFGPVIKILLKYNPDLEGLTGSGLCAYELAALSGFPETAKALYLYQKANEDKHQVDLCALNTNEMSTDEKERRTRGNKRYGTTLERNHVDSILCQLKLRMYFPKFENAGINLTRFLQLTDQDLVNIGITNMGHRIKLMEVVRQMHNNDWKRSSLISFPPNSTIALPDATLFCNNVAYHVDLMSATLKYLITHANRPCETSTVLSSGIDMSQKARFKDYCDKLNKSSQALDKSINLFRDLILKIKDNVEYKVGDYVGNSIDEI